jgi:ATP-dependent DNA helicase RecG
MVMVEIFDDRVEITNPGSVPKGITKDNFGNTSVTRNPVIASLLHRAHYIERMGTGIIRMNHATEMAGLEKPVFQTESFFFKVIFKRNEAIARRSLGNIKSIPSNGNCSVEYGKSNGDYGGLNGGNVELTYDNRMTVINMLKNEPAITIADISKKAGISIRSVERIMAVLKKGGEVECIGSKKSGYWQVKANGGGSEKHN